MEDLYDAAAGAGASPASHGHGPRMPLKSHTTQDGLHTQHTAQAPPALGVNSALYFPLPRRVAGAFPLVLQQILLK